MKKLLRIFMVAIISNSLIFFPLVNVSAADALALPSGDLVAPEIKHDPITAKIAPGELANISATVTDNVAVKDVIIFYRNVGAIDFSRAKMTRELGTDVYTAALPDIMDPGVEYYIQATDGAGNTILRGHTFSPLTIAVASDGSVEEPDVMAATSPEGAEPAKKGISKWVWIGLGVLAVGAIAGGGGGGGGGTAAVPTTGTVTITGPTP